MLLLHWRIAHSFVYPCEDAQEKLGQVQIYVWYLIALIIYFKSLYDCF